MTNAKILLIIIASLLIGATVTYSFSSSPEEQIEKQNKQNTKDCLSRINYWSWSSEIQASIVACWKMELKKVVGWTNETIVSSASGVIEEASWNKTVSLECEWGERTWKVEWIEFHYTATDDTTTLQSIKNSHSQKYWAEHIGYHYVIKSDWEITQTRNEKCIAGADKWSKNNYRFIQIAFIGDDKPTEKQTESILILTKQIQLKYKLPVESVSAHQEWWPKSKKESLDYWYWSKEEFIKRLRNQYSISIYDTAPPELWYMWKAWGDLDFIGTIYQESRINNDSIWDGGQSIWYCQIHKWYQPWWYAHYKSLKTYQERLNYCNELYNYAKSLKWWVWSRFHWYGKRQEHIKNINLK